MFHKCTYIRSLVWVMVLTTGDRYGQNHGARTSTELRMYVHTSRQIKLQTTITYPYQMVGQISPQQESTYAYIAGFHTGFSAWGWGNSLYINKVRDWVHSSPRNLFLRFGLTIDFSISLSNSWGGGNPSFPPPCMKPCIAWMYVTWHVHTSIIMFPLLLKLSSFLNKSHY